jgi:ABC-type amino acid transport system permease subunit
VRITGPVFLFIDLRIFQGAWKIFMRELFEMSFEVVKASLPMFFSGLKLTLLYSFLGIAGSIFIGLYYRSNEYLLMLVVFYALILIPLILLLDWLERRVRYGTFGN